MTIAQLLIVLIIALLVIKPERFPEVAYFMGKLVARVKRYSDQILKNLH